MEIKNNAHGKGLFSTKPYKKEDIIRVLQGDIFSYPTRESIYIGHNKHIYDEYGIFINHSFMPNIKICTSGHYSGAIIALKDIENDEELMFNYNDSELVMAAPFSVNGEQVCGKSDN